MKKIIISACLCGENCKYNGGNNYNALAKQLVDEGKAFMVCPEVDGGLPTPRIPAEIVDGKVVNQDGVDVSYEYQKGALHALKVALDNDVELAILQARSPSCGSKQIYDGTFSGKLIDGMGVTSKLLRQHGIKVITIDEYKNKK